jgi:hypothetical protein
MNIYTYVMRDLKLKFLLFVKSADFWTGDKTHLERKKRLKAVLWQLKRVRPGGVFL